jgi:hypothetical protein
LEETEKKVDGVEKPKKAFTPIYNEPDGVFKILSAYFWAKAKSEKDIDFPAVNK